MGFTRVMSGRCDPPRYGSFTITWSPSPRLPPISSRSTSIVIGIEPRWTGMCSACATIRPSASKSAQLASIRSLMFGEYAVLRRAIPISSGTNATAFWRTSSSEAPTSGRLQLEDAVPHNLERPVGRDDGRGLVLLDDGGALPTEADRESRPLPYGAGHPPLLEQRNPPRGRGRFVGAHLRK